MVGKSKTICNIDTAECSFAHENLAWQKIDLQCTASECVTHNSTVDAHNVTSQNSSAAAVTSSSIVGGAIVLLAIHYVVMMQLARRNVVEFRAKYERSGGGGDDDDEGTDYSDADDTSDEDDVESLDDESSGSALPSQQDDIVIKPRTNTPLCRRTPVACPGCKTAWQPDDQKHYTLFMAFGMKIFCQTCLLQYGWATALHACPLCQKPADYDPSQYDKEVSCGKCKGAYGYSFFNVTPQLVRDVRAKEAAAEAAAARKAEREERAAKKGRGDTGAEDIDLLIGQCMIDNSCPLCKKEVKSKHRLHVVECAKVPAAQRVVAKTPQVRKFVVDDEGSAK
ncbi:MAG: hypothetical protein Q8J97_15035, partial [Flavobacteriaceae bacterium]|nr:hypothetical protein [Flavobacteriaceae bacterium]